MPLAVDIAALLVRELDTLRRTVSAYPDPESLWARPAGAPNSTGTLSLHLAGNLRHYIGAVLGRTGYVRDRPAEFAARGLAPAVLDAELADAAAVVTRVLGALDEATLAGPYPEPIGGMQLRTDACLLHLLSHCAYHVGQADYHRRIVTGTAAGVGAMALRDVPGARPVA